MRRLVNNCPGILYNAIGSYLYFSAFIIIVQTGFVIRFAAALKAITFEA